MSDQILPTCLSLKFQKKRELQQTALNNSSDIDFKDFVKIYKRCTAELFSFLVNNTTLPSDLEKKFKWIYNKIMTIDDEIEDEKIQYDINRKPAKISVLSLGKVDKYNYYYLLKNK